MIIEGNKIQPSEGYKYVTNGETYSACVYLGIYDSVDNWHDTNEEPPTPEPPVDEETRQLGDVVNDAYNMANDLI